jgi:hypothetical protein
MSLSVNKQGSVKSAVAALKWREGADVHHLDVMTKLKRQDELTYDLNKRLKAGHIQSQKNKASTEARTATAKPALKRTAGQGKHREVSPPHLC